MSEMKRQKFVNGKTKVCAYQRAPTGYPLVMADLGLMASQMQGCWCRCKFFIRIPSWG